MATKRSPKPRPKTSSARAPARAPAAARCYAVPSARAPASRPASGRTLALPTPAAVHERAQRWALVTARDLMRRTLVTVDATAELSEVERVLADHRIHGAPVVDGAGRIVGVVSVSDLMARYAEDPDARRRRDAGWFRLSAEGLSEEDLDALDLPDSAEETAQDVMTPQVFTVPAGAGLKEVADVLCEHGVHRVLVEDEGRLVGLVSTMDVLEALRA